MANGTQGRHAAPKHAAPKGGRQTTQRSTRSTPRESRIEDRYEDYSYEELMAEQRPASRYAAEEQPVREAAPRRARYEDEEQPTRETASRRARYEDEEQPARETASRRTRYEDEEQPVRETSSRRARYTEEARPSRTAERSPRRTAGQSTPSRRQREAYDDEPPAREKKQLGKGARFLIVLAALFVFGCIAGFGTIRMITHGPSEHARIIFVRTLDDTTTLGKVPYLFLPEEDVLAALDTSKDSAESSTVRYGMEKGAAQTVLTANDERPAYENMIELLDISGGNWKGKMILCHDPMLLKLGTPNDTAAQGYGEFVQVEDYVAKLGGIAGTTAAGFRMATNTPFGFVINNGELLYKESDKRYGTVGFDKNHIMSVRSMTAQDAVDAGYDIAVCWKPILIQDGVKRTGLGGGFNPRAAIGQTADGTIVLVVIEGRMISSLGATLDELADFMEAQGCINAMNLDSGKSSIMVYEGVQLTRVAIGSGLTTEYRALPNAFVVMPEE